MPRYVYEVRDHIGRSETGVLSAAGLLEASRSFRREGKAIISLREEPGNPADIPAGSRRRIKKDQVVYFAAQLAVMVDTGVPLAEALEAVADSCDHPEMQTVLRDLTEQVKGGAQFSVALERHPKVFSHLFVALMRASEASGQMGQMLQRLSTYMEQERETLKRIRSALTYPFAMLSFCVLVVLGMLIFILPRFEKIYGMKGALLPAPTRVLMAVSRGMVDNWPILFAAIPGLGAASWAYLRTPGGQRLLDRIRINLPVIGRMYRRAYLARSLRTMATMVATDVGMLDGLGITAQVAGNYYYQKIWIDLAEGVKEGASLSEQLYSFKLIPRTISQMIAAGERTGRMATVMNRVAGFCEDELRLAVKTVTSMIEPLMIVIMGLIIGGIAVALLLPIFSLSKVVAH